MYYYHELERYLFQTILVDWDDANSMGTIHNSRIFEWRRKTYSVITILIKIFASRLVASSHIRLYYVHSAYIANNRANKALRVSGTIIKLKSLSWKWSTQSRCACSLWPTEGEGECGYYSVINLPRKLNYLPPTGSDDLVNAIAPNVNSKDIWRSWRKSSSLLRLW